MADLKITLTDTELSALKSVALDPLNLIQNFASERSRIAINNICNQLMVHCNDNEIAMKVGKEAQVKQAFDLGLVYELDSMEDILPADLETPEQA